MPKFKLIYLGDNKIIGESDYLDYIKLLRDALIDKYGPFIRNRQKLLIVKDNNEIVEEK